MVYFDGVVSEGLLYSLSIVNQYYNSVYNNDDRLYKKINISVKKEEPVLRKKFSGDAVIAYSGGIDASHLLLSQKEKLCGAQNVNIKTAIMFQGLEILSSDNEKYARKYDACKETLDFYEVELVKLNLPDEEQGYLRYKWNLCAGLYLFANTGNYTHALVGSGGEGLNNMWYASDEGTPLIVDYFSSPAMTVRLEGSELTRTEKCKLLTTSDIIMKNLIVCFFTNYEKTFNCGYCPKCIRTTLNFLALGYPPPFVQNIDKTKFLKKMKKYVLNSTPLDFVFWQDILDNTILERRKDQWYKLLKKYIKQRRRKSLYDFLFEPIILAKYRLSGLLSYKKENREKYDNKCKKHQIRIRDNNVNIEKYFDNMGQQAFAYQMQKEKRNAQYE